MGKLSRKKTFENKTTDDKQQRKISSFFDNKSTNKTEASKLFTSISAPRQAATAGTINLTGSSHEKANSNHISDLSLAVSSDYSDTRRATNISGQCNSIVHHGKSKSSDKHGASCSEKEVICLDESESEEEKVRRHDNDGIVTNIVDNDNDNQENLHRDLIGGVGITNKNTKKQESLPVEKFKENSEFEERESHFECRSVISGCNGEEVKAKDIPEGACYTSRDNKDKSEELPQVVGVTPLKSTQKATSALSPDIICNTPGSGGGGSGSDGGGMRFKSKSGGGRSFLRSFHLVTKQPDLKPAEMRLNAKSKRRVNKASNGVSIDFNNPQSSLKSNCPENKNSDSDCNLEMGSSGKDSATSSEKENTQTSNEVDVISSIRTAYDESNRNFEISDVGGMQLDKKGGQELSCLKEKLETPFVHLLSKPLKSHTEQFESSDFNSNSNDMRRKQKSKIDDDNETQDGLGVKETEIVEIVDCEEEAEERVETKTGASVPTPTKIYYQSDMSDLIKVKRLAKPGLSPDSKRQTGDLEKVTEKNECNISREDSVQKVKRNLNLNLNSEMDVEGINFSDVIKMSDPFEDLLGMNTEHDGKMSVLENVENQFSLSIENNACMLGINNDNSSDMKKNSSSFAQQNHSSKKFTVKKAAELGWTGMKSASKTVTATLKDDNVLDELMKGLKPTVDGDSNNLAWKSPKDVSVSKTSTKKKRSSIYETSLDLDKDSKPTKTSLSVPSDEVFRSLGLDLPEDNSETSSSSSAVYSVAGDKAKKQKGSTNESNVVTKANVQNSDQFSFMEDDSLMLGIEDDEVQILPEKAKSEDLSRSFGALSPFKKPQGLPKKTVSSKPEFTFTDQWHRFQVNEVFHDSHADETYLILYGEKKPTTPFYCTLRGFWVDTKISEGDIVNIICQFDANNRCTLDDKSGLLVVSPDLLLSGTSVVSSVFCARKSVLNEKFKGLDQGNAHMLYGSVIHSLFQTVLKDSLRQHSDIMRVARTLLAAPKFLHAMYSLGVTESAVMEEILQYIPPLLLWLDKHMESPNTSTLSNKQRISRSDVVVTDIQDIEENIWSPRFGVKGKIDLTVRAKLRGENGLVQEKTVPLELKTGKASFSSEHKGQVTLYSMMYGDRRGDPGEGLLLYLKTGQMESVQVKPQSMSGLIQLRNSLASYFQGQVSQRLDEGGHMTASLGPLPKPINNQRACAKCAHLLNCTLYQRSVKSDATTHSLPASHPMTQLVPDTLGHLGQDDLDYFTHWVTCLQMEEHESNKRHLGPIWNMGSGERERKGDCLSHMTVQSSELGIQESQGYNEGKGCSLTFVRHDGFPDLPPLDSVGLTVNDAVVVSSEDGRFIALATGFIRTLSAKHVEVIVDRDNLYDISVYKSIEFRLDRNTSFSTSGQLMANLTRLMENSPHASRLRDVIIRKRQPHFEMKIPMNWVRTMKPIFKELNKPQKAAILKVLMATDFTLIRGFPGTGKTSTIVALVKVFHLLNKSVLLTSYTHSAVDNILLKLQGDNIPFLRLGRQARVHPAIRKHSAEILTSSIPSVEELKKFYNSYSVIATSCLGVSHTLFSHRTFDVCIVDEASQVLQPACLGPLFHSTKFVLVGDTKQLAPVVQSKGAKSIGMDESLFSRLEDGGATYDLNLQYRMNKVIMSVSNSLVYEGKLECGNQEVAKGCLDLELSKLENIPEWMKATLNSEISKSVIFLDTHKAMSSRSTPEGQSGIQNELEASIVESLLQTLQKASVNSGDIGVISPYRSQVKLLQRKVQCCPLVSQVEVNTVDQYQGRDKRVIIVSFALSDETASDHAGELLKDVRRLNVAMTRARHKLVLVGDASTLKAWPYLEGIITDLRHKECVIQVPAQVLDT